ncbi:hypothetical protein AMECASPLE_025858 [Ameca splendens]|uniref:Uncharacterized protein n=1 Tax=Ameca splendens TaxID=208324 RepID=A0ABV0XTN3_9TELE
MFNSQLGGLEELGELDFLDFHRSLISESTPAGSRSTGSMKNPVYWAVLVGMTILFMEQGPQRNWTEGHSTLNLQTASKSVI